MPTEITEKQIQDLERIVYRTLQYGKLCNTKYFNHLDMNKYMEYLHDTYRVERDVVASSESKIIRDTRQWLKMEVGELATNGIGHFINNLDKLANIIGGWMRNLKIKWKLRKLNPDYINEKISGIKSSIADREAAQKDEPKATEVYAPDMSLLEKRLNGYVNICETIHNIAESSDADSFDSDKTWDSFAQQSNGALKAVRPRQGMFFRELKRIEPYVHHFDATKSDWNEESKLTAFAKFIWEVKESVTVKIQDDIKFIKKITDGLKSEVSHTQIHNRDVGGAIIDKTPNKTVAAGTLNDSLDESQLEEFTIRYARGYVASKFILQLQDMLAAEMLYLVNDVPKMFAYKDNKKSKPITNQNGNTDGTTNDENKKEESNS